MIRLATLNDIDGIMKCLYDAKAFLKESGSTQWNGPLGYPNKDVVLNDIKENGGYVIEENNTILAYAAFLGHEKEYDNPDAHWQIDTNKYLTIHRIAVSNEARGRGYGKALIMHSFLVAEEKKLDSVRVDTHPKNLIMKKMLNELGFIYCGEIIYSYIPLEPLRLIYEKIINR